MHFCVLVFTESKPDEKALSKLLRPFYESHWDWWQQGGRYTGRLTDYEPEKDERNWRVCEYCNGTGVRLVAEGRCNGCTQYLGKTGKKGVLVVWPTDWVSYEGDQQLVRDVREKLLANPIGYAVVTKSGGWVDKEAEGKYIKAKEVAVEAYKDGWVTVVDCHN